MSSKLTLLLAAGLAEAVELAAAAGGDVFLRHRRFRGESWTSTGTEEAGSEAGLASSKSLLLVGEGLKRGL